MHGPRTNSVFFWSPEWFGSYSLKPAWGQWEDFPSSSGCRGAVGARMVLFKELSPSLKPQIPALVPSPHDPELLLIFSGWAEGSGCSKGIPPWVPSALPSAGEDEDPFPGQSCSCWERGAARSLCALGPPHPPGPVLPPYHFPYLFILPYLPTAVLWAPDKLQE